ncbi:uncharacterized protein LOC126839503 [Adelges cooleyi]|uniref:uncharacterized protein LOC126839503 n=1 Tax=Adelges cooleyi TaxID=133065 RepID=UPI00218069D1|nr:uncharacterized protein LOC126839503 [Adelges cooleyi]
MNTSKNLYTCLAIITLAATLLLKSTDAYQFNQTKGINWEKYHARQNTYGRTFVETILKFSLIEEKRIDIGEKEIDLLTNDCTEFNPEKELALEHFFRRMLVLQCNFGVMLFKSLSVSKASGEARELPKINEYIKQMMSIFYEAKSIVHNCFWLIHIGIVAFEMCGQKNSASVEFKYVTQQVNQNLDQFCRACKQKKIVPVDISIDQIDQKFEEYALLLKDHPKLNQHMTNFQEWNYTLFIVAQNLEQICQPIGEVSWGATIEMMRAAITLADSDTCKWYLAPYKNVVHQMSVGKVVEAIVLYRVVIHLMSYAAVLGGNVYDVSNPTEFWLLLKEPLLLAIDVLDVKNGVLWALRYHMITETIDLITVQSMTKYILNSLKNKLIELSVPKVDTVLGKFEEIEIDLTEMVAKQNAEDLKKYLEDVQSTLPVSLSFLRFFLDGQYNDTKDHAIFDIDNNVI